MRENQCIMKKKKIEKKEEVSLPILNNDYLLSLADKLHLINPSKEIIYNTLKDIAINFYNKGYVQRIKEHTKFKNQYEKTFQTEWNVMRDIIEDYIHNK